MRAEAGTRERERSSQRWCSAASPGGHRSIRKYLSDMRLCQYGNDCIFGLICNPILKVLSLLRFRAGGPPNEMRLRATYEEREIKIILPIVHSLIAKGIHAPCLSAVDLVGS